MHGALTAQIMTDTGSASHDGNDGNNKKATLVVSKDATPLKMHDNYYYRRYSRVHTSE